MTRRAKASEILTTIRYGGGAGMADARALKTTGAAMARLWRSCSLVEERNGVLMIRGDDGKWVKVNADNGKNRGWLLPPVKKARYAGEAWREGLHPHPAEEAQTTPSSEASEPPRKH